MKALVLFSGGGGVELGMKAAEREAKAPTLFDLAGIS